MRWVLISLLLVLITLSACTEDPDTNINETDFKDFSNITVKNKTDIANMSGQFDDINNIIEDDYDFTNKSIMVGAFNVQIFGVTKARNEFVMGALGNIIDDYDILAFQEIRDESQTSFEKLMLEELPEYNYKLSPRLGRTSSKEQYAFIYRTGIIVEDEMVYDDYNDVFEREPYMAKFTVGTYDFVLIVIHIKPTDAQEEIRHLQEVIDFTRGYYKDNDVFIIGDLNADCSYYEPGTYLTQYEWLIKDDADTTTSLSHCAYDRIISISKNNLVVDSGVDRFDLDEAKDEELVKAISDHYPIYMELFI